MKLPATLKRFASKIQDIDRDQDGWSVGLKRGWYCWETETHCIMENTLAEIAAKFSSVVRCSEETCAKTCPPEDWAK